MLFRVVMALLALALAGTLPGCGAADADRDVLVDLATSVPADLAAEGMLLRRGGDGQTRLIAQLGLDAAEVQASLTTGAPAVRLLRSDAASSVTAVLRDEGFTTAEAPAGWELLVRPEGATGFVGIPAVAVGDGVVAVGSVDELGMLADASGSRLPVPDDVLAAAQTALVQPSSALGPPPSSPVATGSVPPFTSVVLTVDEDGQTGHLALRLPSEGAQEDAVGLAVRIRTAGPVDGSGRLLIEPSAPLTTGDVVSLQVRWVEGAADPHTLVAEALGSGLLDFLGAA